MSKVVNLNTYRKARAKSERVQKAKENRLSHGQSKATVTQHEKDQAKAIKQLEGHKKEALPPLEKSEITELPEISAPQRPRSEE